MAQTTPRVSLDDRYLVEDGTVYLSGIQALVRLPLDQARRDRRVGLRTGTFISGYPGSPLGSYDLAIQRAGKLLEPYDVVHVPSVNEEIAATAISGTQMLDQYPHSRFDGVTGIWYGKGPGVDRSGDALKHGNFAGTSTHGAVVVLAAEDHEAKSSTMPYQDDYAFMSAGIPILYPASVGEFLSLGLHAIALSRYSGCWVAMKLVGQLCDGGETVSVHPHTPAITLPELDIDGRPFRKKVDFVFFPGKTIETERHIYYERHQAVLAYARANQLDRIEVQRPNDRLGIITAGKTYADVRQALLDLGLDDDALGHLGIRLLRIGLTYPIDAELVRRFAHGLDEIVVIEEKRGFLESQVKEALCGLPHPIRVVGKFDEHGRPLFPIQGGMDSDTVAEHLGPRLLARFGQPKASRRRRSAVAAQASHAERGEASVSRDAARILRSAQDDSPPSNLAPPTIERRLQQLRSVRHRAYDSHSLRTPNYCSGCPHNTSTVLLEGQTAWGSPGCHSFASIMDQPERRIDSMSQYGGEGPRWVGLAPFTDRPHIVQNVGDGSLFHSSYLNIRFCVAAGANITFKLLYNGYIANTGAQPPTGAKSIPALTRMLAEEGVRSMALVTKHPETYRRERLGANTTLYPVDRYEQAQRDLAQQQGVTMLIYDEECANERRRQQKRGKREIPNRFVVINEEVCEGCGHCGAVSNCMSLHKVETEFGEKTRIHTSSCNQDYFCLKGDCPSFVTVETRHGTGYATPTPPRLEADELPEPRARVPLDRPYHVYIPGVGGTGVITVNALLAFAGWMDGLHVLSYDQTGAAQKWGPVLSSLVLARTPSEVGANKVGLGKADLYLASDVMAAVAPVNLDRCAPDRTVAVINTSLLPSGEMVRNVHLPVSVPPMAETIDRFTRADCTVRVEARGIAEALFGDYMATNLVALGVAYQSGLLPLTSESIEGAIRLNGVQVEQNLQAFRYGRLWVIDPARVQTLLDPPPPGFDEERQRALARLSAAETHAYETLLERCAHLDDETRRLLAIRVAELIEYQDADYARSYVDFVREVAERERAARGATGPLAQTVARHLYKLMAYKDEYEVARLHLKDAFHAQARQLFEAPVKLSYNLHPPLLRAMGFQRKLSLGPWFTPALKLLRSLKRLRGTSFDVFGYAQVRREERRLIDWYQALVLTATGSLTPHTYDTALELARLPDRIRGYEQIKLDNVVQAKQRAEELLAHLNGRAAAGAAAHHSE